LWGILRPDEPAKSKDYPMLFVDAMIFAGRVLFERLVVPELVDRGIPRSPVAAGCNIRHPAQVDHKMQLMAGLQT